MIESCLKNGVHYLDLTGEAQVGLFLVNGMAKNAVHNSCVDSFVQFPFFQFVKWVASLDNEAKDKGVMLMCSVGFDVVPGGHICAALFVNCPPGFAC